MNQPEKKKTGKAGKIVTVLLIILALLLLLSLAALIGLFVAHSQKPAEQPSKGGEVNLAFDGEAERSFTFDNLFPGDTETLTYKVNVDYRGPVAVKFFPKLVLEEEKDEDKYYLEDVMNCRVALPESGGNGEVLYDGPLSGLTEPLSYGLSHSEDSKETLTYEITFSLDTSVGNEYQGKEIRMTLHWEAEAEEAVTPPAEEDKDSLKLVFIITLAVVIPLIILVIVLLILAWKGKKKDKEVKPQ